MSTQPPFKKVTPNSRRSVSDENRLRATVENLDKLDIGGGGGVQRVGGLVQFDQAEEVVWTYATTASGSLTIDPTQDRTLFELTGGGCVVTLPSAAAVPPAVDPGSMFLVAVKCETTGNSSLVPVGAELIDGLSSLTLAGGSQRCVGLASNGVGWRVVWDTGSAVIFSGARVHAPGTQVVAASGFHAASFNTADYDTNSYASLPSTKLTVPTTGYYTFGGFAQVSGGSTGAPTYSVQLAINGGGTLAQEGQYWVSGNTLTVVDSFHMTAGDYVELLLFHNCSVSQTVTAAALWIARMG